MKSGTESNLKFNLRRFANFLRLMLSNKMAAVGLFMFLVSAGAALAAPIVYPQNPQNVASAGFLAQPQWVSYFPEGYYLSSNMVVVNNPGFNSPSALQEWSYSNTAQSPDVSISRATIASTGSIQISSSSPLSLTVYKTFHYPYRGPPSRFTLPSVAVRSQGASASNPIVFSLFLNRGVERSFTLWSKNLTTNDAWISPPYPLDSGSPSLPIAAGVQGGLLPFTEVVFSRSDDYTLGFTVTFSAPGTINVTSLGLRLLGNAYGLLGADSRGSDLFAELLWGARTSLFVGLVASFIGIGLGLLVGLMAGYKTGIVDEVLMRFTDMMLVLPSLPLLLVLVAVVGPSIFNIIILIGFLGWMGFARVIRSQVLSIKERPFIEAAKAAGAGTRKILTTHIFRNVVSLTYVNLALAVPAAILTEAALSFLGLGDPLSISWGQIISNAQAVNALNDWWWIIPPGIGIAFVSLSFVLIGYSLDEIFNPKLRRRR